jgi:4-aminobutyrate aminotransferase
VAKRGRGIRIEDVDGNEFLDFAAGIAVNSTGALSSRGGEGNSEAGGGADSHLGDGFLLRVDDGAGGRLSAVAPMPGPHRFTTATRARRLWSAR